MTIQRQPKTQNFPGFPKQLGKGQFYKYPVIMDYWCFCLSGSEQKILDYLIRRTYGFNKIEDTISLSQFKDGITKRDGTVLDRGTGIKNDSTILKASKSLEKNGFIEIIKTKNKTTLYKLRLLHKIQKGTSRNIEVAPVRNTDTIDSNTINSLQKAYINKIKPYKKPYYMGSEMRYKKAPKQWYVVVNGEWLEFAGEWEEIKWTQINST